MNCREVKELLIAYLDGEVTPSEGEMIEAHLAECASCREEAAHLAEMQRRLGRSLKAMAANASPSPQAWSRLQARLTKHAPQKPWPQRLAPGVWHKLTEIPLTMKGDVLMRHKFTVATIATLVLAACMVAFVPTVRGQVGEAIAKWFRIEFPGGKVAVEMSGPAEFTPLHPTYLPAGLQSSGISTKVSGESESVELVCHNEEQFVAVTQTKAPADRALPAGRKVTVKGQKGVLIAGLEGTFEGGPRIPKDALVQKEERPPTEPIRIRGERISIPYDDGKRLVWYVSDVKVEMLSNLSEEEMLKVAESLVPAEAEEGEAPFHPPDLPIEEKVEGGLIREGPIESNP